MAKAIKSEIELKPFLESGNEKLRQSEELKKGVGKRSKDGDYTVGKSYLPKMVTTQVLMYLFLTIFALFIIVPFIFMISSSFISSTTFDTNKTNGTITLLPIPFTFENYKSVFSPSYIDNLGQLQTKTSFWTYFLNTFISAGGSMIVTVVTSVLAAFAFARLNFKGKNALFMVILATMMIPGEMMIITNYALVKEFNWENTFYALILVHGVSVFYIFYLRQTFQQIPNELYLAAKVDGYTDWKYLLKVMIPIGMPTIVTIIILSLMGGWNSYVWPTLVANGKTQNSLLFGSGYDIRLVSNGLMASFSSEFSDNQPGKMAGSVVVTLPLFIIFIFFHKYIMKGVSRSGIKG